jgi:hypothetical protein
MIRRKNVNNCKTRVSNIDVSIRTTVARVVHRNDYKHFSKPCFRAQTMVASTVLETKLVTPQKITKNILDVIGNFFSVPIN